MPTSDLKPGDDLSYYLGPDATCATAEQVAELEAAFAEAKELVEHMEKEGK